MKGRLLIVLALVIQALFASGDALTSDYADDAIIVRFKAGAVTMPGGKGKAPPGDISFSPQALGDSMVALAADTLEDVGSLWNDVDLKSGLLSFKDIYRVTFPDTIEIDEALARIGGFPGVREAENIYKVEYFWTPNDPLFSDYQWQLENTGQVHYGLPDADMDLSAAWDSVRGGDFPVYVLDTGIADHDDLTHVDCVACVGC